MGHCHDMTYRVVLVTGGTRGIGRAIAERFLAAGATVVVCGRTTPAEPVRAEGREATFLPADVRDPDAAAALVAQVGEQQGRIDVLVNNAGGSIAAPAATMPARRAASVVALNLLAPFYVAQAANAVMQEQTGGGQIINIGSVGGLNPAPGTAVYAAAKAGLTTLTRALALEWGPLVRVNQLTVGLVETDGSAVHYGGDPGIAAVHGTIPLQRMARPEDIASACLLLSSPLAAYVSGAELRVDGGGWTPGWLVAVQEALTAAEREPGAAGESGGDAGAPVAP
jgi:NAD(P)-dependent dehydrogenase (short-subunit alcohol dehydrogenase family)